LLLHSVAQAVFIIFALWLTSHQLLGCDKKARKSPAAFRRERAFRHAELSAQRYAALPPARKAMDAEKRNRKLLRRAKAAVSWAIVAEDFSQQEADGAILLALRRDATLGQDSERLHAAALSILKVATCQDRYPRVN
jgi:hypothetical protein